jgi:hypothetical protein
LFSGSFAFFFFFFFFFAIAKAKLGVLAAAEGETVASGKNMERARAALRSPFDLERGVVRIGPHATKGSELLTTIRAGRFGEGSAQKLGSRGDGGRSPQVDRKYVTRISLITPAESPGPRRGVVQVSRRPPFLW